MTAMAEQQDETYNGWSNRETWLVNLWLSNDEGMQNHVDDLARAADTDASERTAQGLLADELKELVEEMGANNEGEVAGLVWDLFTSAAGRVDYYEVAQAWLDGLEDDV